MEQHEVYGARIKVIGVGGAGNNAIDRMIAVGVKSAEFIAMNTDVQALYMCKSPKKIQLGAKLTSGLGAGANPEVGKKAAEESIEDIRKVLENTHLLFITAGMGGGTGTGAAPVIARVAKEMDILTIAVVTKPFESWEGKPRMENALKGIEELKKHVDTVIIIPNEKITTFAPKGTSIMKAFHIVDDILRQAVQGVSDIIVNQSLINLDFADIRTIMKNKGNAHIGIGRGKGENKVLDAVRQAVQSPLLETNIEGATGVIINIIGGPDMDISAVTETNRLVKEVVDPEANIIAGMGLDETLKDEVVVTIIATGFNNRMPLGFSPINSYQNASGTESLGIDTSDKYDYRSYGIERTEPASVREQPSFGFGGRTKTDDFYRNDYKKEESAAADVITSPRMDVDTELPPFIARLKNLK